MIGMKLLTKQIIMLCGFLLLGQAAMAQFTATGTVKDATDESLIGVTVVVKGTTIGTSTDFDGNYSLEVPSNEATLVFSFIGFKAEEMAVSAAAPTVNVTLNDDVSNLEEIVVTGLASTVKRSNLANSVASISSRELTGVTQQNTMDGALYGKFKGADIRSNSGSPGGGMSVRLRGVTSINGDQQPLYIVDGVYIDNSSVSSGTNVVSAAAGGGNSSSNQDDASNRIADIDPEDIENLEILKGASAAAVYGSRAAGGVIIITTKKGKAGKTKVGFNQTFGIAKAIKMLGGRDWDRAKIESTFSAADAVLFDQNGLNDYEKELYGNNGFLSTSRLNISGGTEKTNFFIGGTYKDDEGIVENTGYKKASVRVNIGHKFNDWFDINLSNNYINSQADRGFFNNSNTNATVGYAQAFTRPWYDLFPDSDGNYPAVNAVGSNVLETVDLVENRENVSRFIGGATGNLKLYSNEKNNLKLVLRAGMDQYTLRTTAVFPQALSYLREPGTLGGASVYGTTVNSNYNLGAVLVHSYYTDSGINFRTQLGVTQENFDRNSVIATATGLNGSQTNLDQATNQRVEQFRRKQIDKGFFIQEEINWDDKVIGALGLRADKSSNNGDANQLYYYPKANLAVNLHNFDFFESGIISQLKPRIAYGEAGRFANFADRFNVLDGTVIGGNAGLTINGLRGNADVSPERQKELEFGVDVGLLDGAIGIDITYYIKTIDDLLLRAQIPTSTGFGAQVTNAGALENRGLEIELKASPLKGALQWDTGVRFWKNRSEITRLDVPAFNTGGFAASLGQGRIEEGQPATQLVGSYSADNCNNCDPDGDGFAVWGDSEADFNMSFNNSLTYKNLTFSFLMHWKEGGDGINLSTLLYDLGGLTWDYDDKTLDPTGAMTNGEYRLNGLNTGDASPWIEDNSYFRVREIGLYYRIPKTIFNDVADITVGFSGRNLINFFDYNSYDPEVSNFGNNVLVNAVEVTPFPSSKTYNFHIKANF